MKKYLDNYKLSSISDKIDNLSFTSERFSIRSANDQIISFKYLLILYFIYISSKIKIIHCIII